MAQVGPGLQFVGLGGFNQAVQQSAVLGSLGSAGEQPVLPPTTKGRMEFSAMLLSMERLPSSI